MARLDQINIVSADPAASAAFYRRLGVEIAAVEEGQFHVGGQDPAGFALDLDVAWFARVWNTGWEGAETLAGRVVVGFGVDAREDVDALFAELVGAGHQGLQPPFDAFWGARYAIVEDPDGVAVGLMSPVDPARRFWPPVNWPKDR